MTRTRKTKKVPSAESIARMADRGQDVSRYFTNRGRMMPPIQRVNVDFTAPMLQELDQAASELNVSQAHQRMREQVSAAFAGRIPNVVQVSELSRDIDGLAALHQISQSLEL